MVTPSAGSVVLLPLPFSDLSASKLRPAVVLADAARGDWILCQITSKPYADPRAIELTDGDFAKGSLHVVSYARPGKLFTADRSLIVRQVGVLKDDSLKKVVDAVVDCCGKGLNHKEFCMSCAAPNNGMHPTANSAAFIRKTWRNSLARRGG